MKRGITIEQLNELSEIQRDNLRKWWSKHGLVGDPYVESFDFDEKPLVYGNAFYSNMHTDGDIPSSKSLPLLDIGQMIEFLNDRTNEHGFEYLNSTCDWFVYIGNRTTEIYAFKTIEYELVDAFWKAVKVLLK